MRRHSREQEETLHVHDRTGSPRATSVHLRANRLVDVRTDSTRHPLVVGIEGMVGQRRRSRQFEAGACAGRTASAAHVAEQTPARIEATMNAWVFMPGPSGAQGAGLL